MSDAYVECLVQAKTSSVKQFLKYFLITLSAASAVLFFLTFLIVALLVAIAAGVGGYFIGLYSDVEYEYLYLDRELTIDKILSKTKRKRVAVYQLDKIEILAPIKSYHLDNFKNRTVKEVDCSIGYEDKPDLRYAMYYEGNEKIILNPSPEMVKVMKNVAPRKIFND